MRKILATILVLSFMWLLWLTACSAKPAMEEYQSGLIEIQVYYNVPDFYSNAFAPGDCAIPLLSTYEVSTATDFAGYSDGWRMVRFEKCVGFAKLR